MAIKSGMFNSVNGDRKYKAEDFAAYFAMFIANGVFPNPSNGFQVMANGNMTVTLKAGKAWIFGYYCTNDSDYNLTIDVADGVLKRIDRIVLRLNYLNREITPVVKKGTFASSPVAPTLQRDADAYEIALADVLVGNGVLSITQANITDLRLNTSLCGIVHGTVDQVDTTEIFNQYQSWFDTYSANRAIEFDTWQEQQEQEFNDWFATIQGTLSGDVAGNLQAQITQLDTDLGNLEQTVAVHQADDLQHVKYAAATGTANTYVVTFNPAPTAYVEGIAVAFKVPVASTATSTLNINGLGAKVIKKANGTDVTNLKAGGIYTVRYDGTAFILQGEGASGNATASDLYSGKTASVDAGDIVGTNPYKRGVTVKAGKDLSTVVLGGTIVATASSYPYIKAVKVGYDGRLYVIYEDSGYRYLRIYNSNDLSGISSTTMPNFKGQIPGLHCYEIDNLNNIYLSEAGCFSKYNSSAQMVFQIVPNDFNYPPQGIEYDKNNNYVYVAMRGNLANKSLIKYTTGGGQVWVKSALTVNGYDVCVDASGNVYYSSTGYNQTDVLFSFTPGGALRWVVPYSTIPGAYNVVFNNVKNLLYVVCGSNSLLYVVNPDTGAVIRTVGPAGTFSGNLSIDDEGVLYVRKATNLYAFDADLTLIWQSPTFSVSSDGNADVLGDYVYTTQYYNSGSHNPVMKLNRYTQYTLK